MKLGHYIYDLLLYMLISLLIFGMIGNGVQPVRLFIIALSPFMVLDALRSPHKSFYYYRYECFFLLFWFIWSVSFFFKAIDEIESLKHTIYLLIHSIGFLEVLWAANKAVSPQHAIKYGWLTVIALSIPIAVYEFLTDFHMTMSFQDTGSTLYVHGVHIERPFASVTFGNLNSYNTVLCWALPSLFMCNLYPKGKFDKALGLLLMAMVTLIIVANASRGAIMCLMLMMATYVYAYYKMGRNRTLLIIIIVVSLGVLFYYLGELFILILERFDDQGMGDDGRTENLIKGFQAFLDSYGLGIGIGNYEPIMGYVYRVQFAAPHNIFLEILVCFGFFVMAGFTCLCIHLIRICLRHGTPFNRNMLIFCGAALVLAGIIDSNYWMKATTWMYFASMYIYLDPRYNRANDDKVLK